MTQAACESMKLRREAATDSQGRCTATLAGSQTIESRSRYAKPSRVARALRTCSFRSQNCQIPALSCGLTRNRSKFWAFQEEYPIFGLIGLVFEPTRTATASQYRCYRHRSDWDNAHLPNQARDVIWQPTCGRITPGPRRGRPEAVGRRRVPRLAWVVGPAVSWWASSQYQAAD